MKWLRSVRIVSRRRVTLFGAMALTAIVALGIWSVLELIQPPRWQRRLIDEVLTADRKFAQKYKYVGMRQDGEITWLVFRDRRPMGGEVLVPVGPETIVRHKIGWDRWVEETSGDTARTRKRRP